MIDQFSHESLLLYLADELSPADRAAVDAMLASDAALRSQLDQLRDAQTICFDAFGQADALQRLPVSEAVATRRVGRAMEQWQTSRYRRPAVRDAEENRLRFPWWCYPLATAAAAMFVLVVWWGNGVDSNLPQAPQVTILNGEVGETIARAEDSWAVSAEPTPDDSRLLALGEEDASTLLINGTE